MRRRLLGCATLAMLAVAALLVAGTQSISPRTFVLDAPDQAQVLALQPLKQTCEGPVTSRGPARGVQIFGAAMYRAAWLRIDARDSATNKLLATGQVRTGAGQGAPIVTLNRDLPGGRPVTICVTNEAGGFSLLGSGAVDPKVVMTGGTPNNEFSLILLGRPQSLLSTLPTVFSRASLWRPAWVGSWTFWVLLVCVFGTFGLGVVAVARAASADDLDTR